MKIHKDCKIELAASKDASRPAIAEPFLDIKDGAGVVVATNGRAMAIVPVEVTEKDASGYLSADCLKAARKLTKQDVILEANGVVTMANGATMPREGLARNEKFPNWRQVMPSDEGYDVCVALDAKMLWELAQAMGTQGVLLSFQTTDASKPIVVGPHTCGRFDGQIKYACEGAKGVLMPVQQKKNV